MVQKRAYVVIVVIALAVVIIGGIQALYLSPSEEKVEEKDTTLTEEKVEEKDTTITEEESFEIAWQFTLNSPTYKYDGEGLHHIKTLGLQCPDCWQFVFEFTCRHAGYGNRSKQMVLQMITHHTAVVTVEGGKVTCAVLDGQWDMINQKGIE